MPSLDAVSFLTPGALGAAIEVTVASIASPTELNSRAAAQGDIILARTTEAGTGTQTWYYADTTSDAESLPYIVSSATAGVKFIAFGGRYQNGAKTFSAPIIVESGRISMPFTPGGTYFGYEAGIGGPGSGTYNTLIGYQCGTLLGGANTGYNNTMVGFEAGEDLLDGFANTGVGIQTLQNCTDGSYNFAANIHALLTLTTGVANNAVGAGSLQNGNPTNCNSLGMYAGRDCNGSGSLFLGHRAGMTETGSNKLYIANNETTTLISGDFSTGNVTIQAGLAATTTLSFGGYFILAGPSSSSFAIRSLNTNIGLLNYQDVNGTSLGFNGYVGANTYQIYNAAGSASGLDLDVATSTLSLPVVGGGIKIKEGSNARMGTATLSGGTVVVNTTAVTANSRIFLTVQSLGTVAVPSGYCVSARTASTSFTILASAPTDTSVVAWLIVEPA